MDILLLVVGNRLNVIYMAYFIDTKNFKIKEEDTGWIDLNNAVKYRKINNVVYISGVSEGYITVGGANYVNVGVLPEGCRPSAKIMFAWTPYGQLAENPSAYINAKGEIFLYNSTASTSYWGFIISYPI